MLELIKCKRTEPRLLADMAVHYSQPKGFVGRNICYNVLWSSQYFGSIVGGSATRFLPGRDDFFGKFSLNEIVNNIFFHIEPRDFGDKKRYPCRNFAEKVLATFRVAVTNDWFFKYGDRVIGFESLVELPRTGEVYKRDGWLEVGITKGFTCKRTAGKGTDAWSGKRVWNTDPEQLRPKRVFVRLVTTGTRTPSLCQAGANGL